MISKEEKKLRILAAGDLHNDISKVYKLSEQAEREKVDLVVLCGDLTFMERSITNIVGPFVKKKKPVLLIPGNHETVATAESLATLYNVTNLHGKGRIYNNIGFFGAGGANIGLFQLDEGEIYNLLKRGYESVKHLDKKVMVTHIHPSETMMERFSSFIPGSSGVRKAITSFKPDILLCSHVHEAEGIEEMIEGTRVINVGKEGKIIDI